MANKFFIRLGQICSDSTTSSNGRYGGHFWLNAGGYFQNAPKEDMYCGGFQGQMVAIIPSDIVIVRMGLKEHLILILMRC
jgi:hypothetical protein